MTNACFRPVWLAWIAALLAGAPCWAQPPAEIRAFPGAEGFGAYARGGRGGKVLRVTNLEDYLPGKEEPIPGSLRFALCEVKGPRTVVFRVSGTIFLKGDLVISEPRLTIAGQTAPGGGVCLRGAHSQISADDVIVRHVRFRPGEQWKSRPATGGGSFEYDTLRILGAKNVIVDHCSLSWALDETMDVWNHSRLQTSNVTVQWCIISESFMYSKHPDGPHGMGMICYGVKGMSLHHNLLAKHDTRGPSIDGGGLYDVRNNVVYLVHAYTGRGQGLRLNYVGNYFKRPNVRTPGRNCVYLFFGPEKYDDVRVFARGNYVEGGGAENQDNWKLFISARFVNVKARNERTEQCPPYLVLGEQDVSRFRSSAPVEIPSRAKVKTDTAEEAYEKVLANGGAVLPKRDRVDQRIVYEVETGTGRIINSPNDVGGYPELKSAPAPPDRDQDGMPDAWEKQHGLSPDNPADANADRDDDGYTNLEEYLNGIDPRRPKRD